jgi:hypothetical protein
LQWRNKPRRDKVLKKEKASLESQAQPLAGDPKAERVVCVSSRGFPADPTP